MLVQDPYDQKLAARLSEYWSWRTPWQRRLWNIGSVAAIKELVEAADALSEKSLVALKTEVGLLVGPDPAIGNRTTKQALGAILKEDLTYGGDGWHQLRQLLPTIEGDYVSRWATLLRQVDRPRMERVARSLAAHLLHLGFSSTYLHRWLRYQSAGRTDVLAAADLVEEMHTDLVRRLDQEFTVVIPASSAPGVSSANAEQWRSANDLARFIESIQGSRTDIRQNGGFVMTVRSRDAAAAVEAARELIDRWDARAELSKLRSIDFLDVAWVEGIPEPIRYGPRRRQVDIGALARENLIYTPLDDDEQSIRIDDALQLAQPMGRGSRSAAITGGWAAIEALLSETREPVYRASQRLASIVACSYPRAELTTLSYLHSKSGQDVLAGELKGETENLKRARLISDAISRGDALEGRGPQDQAAYDRMKEVLNRPSGTLNKIRHYVQSALNRLYRQRNLIVHGGRVSGSARAETLSTVPPLVGAGLDRIVHAWFRERTDPRELAARADVGLRLVGAAPTPHVTELLEPP